MPEIIELYREAHIALVLFTVDCESGMGAKRVSNYEVAEQALKNDDICIAFASIDPHKGKYGAREARDLIENHGVKGFKFHGIAQNAHPADRMAYPIYEVIAEYEPAGDLPHRPFGHGHRDARRRRHAAQVRPADPDRRCRGRFPRHEDHPRPPELAVGRREPVDGAAQGPTCSSTCRGWSPKYFPKQVIQYANTQLKHKMLFGTDFPLIHPDKWIAAAAEVGFRDEVMPLIMKDNAAKVLGLA